MRAEQKGVQTEYTGSVSLLQTSGDLPQVLFLTLDRDLHTHKSIHYCNLFKSILLIFHRIFCTTSATVPEVLIGKFIVYLQPNKLIFSRKKKGETM